MARTRVCTRRRAHASASHQRRRGKTRADTNADTNAPLQSGIGAGRGARSKSRRAAAALSGKSSASSPYCCTRRTRSALSPYVERPTPRRTACSSFTRSEEMYACRHAEPYAWSAQVLSETADGGTTTERLADELLQQGAWRQGVGCAPPPARQRAPEHSIPVRSVNAAPRGRCRAALTAPRLARKLRRTTSLHTEHALPAAAAHVMRTSTNWQASDMHYTLLCVLGSTPRAATAQLQHCARDTLSRARAGGTRAATLQHNRHDTR